MTLKSVGTLVLWCVLGVTIGAFGVSLLSGPDSADLYPSMGETVDLSSISQEFAVDATAAPKPWLLVLSSSCAVCLGLTSELDKILKAARCENAQLFPLVINRNGVPADSMLAVLRSHQLNGYIGPSQVISKAAGVHIVPTLVKLEARGRVVDIWSPRLFGTWPPPAADCQMPD